MILNMGDSRVASAIARLERALARLEAASARPQPPSLFDGNELAQLRQRHQSLRGTVEGAIARIDSVLGAAERG
jgi:hypothetical protein